MPLVHGLAAVAVSIATCLCPQDPGTQSEIDKLKQEVEQLRRELESQRSEVNSLKKEAPAPPAEQSALEREFEQALKGDQPQAPEPAPTQRPLAGTALLNPKISFDVITDASAFSKTNPDNFGGHDPTARGFQIPQAELSLQSAVDPFFSAEAHIVYSLREGETDVELEEAFANTTALPDNLQVRAGTFFTHFGRQNAQHAHVWQFVTIPIVYPRFFGPDGFRNPGAEISWLAPTPFFLELSYTVQQSDGENGTSFLGQDGGTLGGYTLVDRKVHDLGDLAHTFRAHVSNDFSETVTGDGGISVMLGNNATGEHNLSEIYGIDYYLKWKPLNAERGFPFVAWQTEYLTRRAEVGPDPTQGLPTDTLHDYGLYSQLVWGFDTGWTTGIRAQLANGTGGINRDTDPLLDKRFRIGPNITYYPSEFSKLRLEYYADFNSTDKGGPMNGVVLQFEFSIGEHAAHTF